MRITKPDWLHHDADKKKLTAIFSVDFHPDGTRLATAGMDNKIRIWNTSAITKPTAAATATTDNESENGASAPRLLSTLTAHSGAVLCVRFSPNARYMASGADDMIVLIWERDSNDDAGQAGGDVSNNIVGNSAETWHPVRRLTGHESDVSDLAWSPDNRFLATCGLDNAIYVWDAQTFRQLAKLTDHSQFVKGVTFDPAGKYLASQSDDRTLKIWRTSDWRLQTTVAKPFEDNIFSTYFCRPSWSPDGDCVAAANAVNGKVPVAAVVSRDKWASDLSFVGHHAAIEAVRFNPRVFNAPVPHPPVVSSASDTGVGSSVPSNDKAATVAASICAAGGQDRGVTVWLTSQSVPIVAATDLFAGNLLDLAWYTPSAPVSQNEKGNNKHSAVVACLAACSFDGTVAVLEFTADELGYPVPVEEQEAMLSKNGWVRGRANGDDEAEDYGGGDGLDRGPSKRPRPIAESVAQLQLEEQGSVLCKVPEESRIAQLMDGAGGSAMIMPAQSVSSATPAATNSTPAPQMMPVPVRTKDGKKRVTPLFVRPLGGGNSNGTAQTAPIPALSSSPAATGAGAGAGSQVVVGGVSAAPRTSVDAPIWIDAQVLGTRQMVGKSSSSFITEPSPLGLQTLVHAQTISAARVHLSVPKVVAQLKATALPLSPQKTASSTPLQGEGSQASSSSSTSYRPTVVAYNTTSQSSTDAMRSRLVCSPQPSSALASASASVSSARQPSAWTKYFAHSVMIVAASDQVTAASLSDGSLHWFDTLSGVRLAPPIVCEAHLAHLRCQDRFCLALDCVGQLSVWDTDAMEATVDRVSIAPLLYSAQLSTTTESKPKATAAAETSSTAVNEEDNELGNTSGDGNDEKVRAPKRHKPMVALTAVDILPAGNDGGCTPALCFSDGRVYIYHTKLRSWIRIGDPAEYVGSDYYICPPIPTASTTTSDTTSASRLRARATTGSTLEFLQERAYYQRHLTNQVNNSSNKNKDNNSKRLFSSTSSSLDDQKSVKYAVTLDHLENQLRGADTVGSDDEVIRYADLLARQLARSADNTVRVSRWLAELLGPPMVKGMLPAVAGNGSSNGASTGITCSWSPTIGSSVPKRQILERILPLLATNRHFQDLVDEYSSALKQVIQQ
ncbi:HIR complex subunit [Coemansia sp. RSA 1200]|nr:HIR complex subunit [Coemansia sp. RSA 1200]